VRYYDFSVIFLDIGFEMFDHFIHSCVVIN
jgi:hypothetical protein